MRYVRKFDLRQTPTLSAPLKHYQTHDHIDEDDAFAESYKA